MVCTKQSETGGDKSCDRHTTLLSDTDKSIALINIFTYLLMHFVS
jgi:hypothetical protein